MCKIPSIKDFPLSAADENNEKPSAEDSTGMRNPRNTHDKSDRLHHEMINLNMLYNISDVDHADTDSKEKESTGKLNKDMYMLT